MLCPNTARNKENIMSIKSDKWIRRMSEEFGMIHPFEPHPIKEAHGNRTISYGPSNYGLDIRCAH